MKRVLLQRLKRNDAIGSIKCLGERAMTEAPFYYWYFVGIGRELLARTLGDPHPFTLPGDKIVERVLAADYGPGLHPVEREPYTGADAVSVVERDGQHFFVFIDVEAERIAIQEQRTDAYGPEGGDGQRRAA